MPVYLLEHIIYRQPLPLRVQKFSPSGESEHFIDSFILAPLTDGLAFNDGFPTIVFMPDTTVKMEFSNVSPVQGAWLSGPYLENVHFRHSKEHVLIVRFNPVMFCSLFNINASQLRYKYVWDLTSALGHHGARLLSSVMSVVPVKDKIRKIEEFVLQLSKDNHYSNALLEQALSAIQEAKGNISVLQLAVSLKVNYKWLERNFTKHIGITPKEYVRLQRFIHTYFDLIKSKDPEIMRIALDNGYCDNNHFTKDFKRFTGKAPLAYLNTIQS